MKRLFWIFTIRGRIDNAYKQSLTRKFTFDEKAAMAAIEGDHLARSFWTGLSQIEQKKQELLNGLLP